MSKTETGMTLVGGALLGAATMYLLDPESGRRRREHLGEAAGDTFGTAWDKTRDISSTLADKASDLAAGLAGHAHHLAHGVSSGVSGEAEGISSGAVGKTVRGWGRSASDMAGDASDSASGWMGDWADRARGMTHGARHRMAKALDPDHVRGPGHAVAYSAAGAGTLALGAGLMYFLDPQRGRPRRAWVGQKMTRFLNDTGRTFRSTGRHVWNRMHGVAHGVTSQARSRLPGSAPGPVDGEQLLRRIWAEVGHVLTYPSQVQIMTSAGGAVTLYGRVPAAEEDRLLATVHAVPGVTQIINRLQAADAGGSGAQGAPPPGPSANRSRRCERPRHLTKTNCDRRLRGEPPVAFSVAPMGSAEGVVFALVGPFCRIAPVPSRRTEGTAGAGA